MQAPPSDRMVQDTFCWIDEACFRLSTDDRQHGWHALRGVFFALRDRLPMEEAFDPAAQLPIVLRGMFFDGYRPANKPEKYGPEEFLLRIDDEIAMANLGDPQYTAQVVYGMLCEHVSPGEMEDVFYALPESIRCILTGKRRIISRRLQSMTGDARRRSGAPRGMYRQEDERDLLRGRNRRDNYDEETPISREE